ncbi:hypothetical protein GIB67_013245 [Kingdonia uniflora]|uniref:Pectinesterase n=1 Tax=Kingdonia uniflora TaxID=39325 RepID=A0A7J7NT98_9MAGN|nr:hypothetical protein GIB67_013245 [Kingdonia uniflora]
MFLSSSRMTTTRPLFFLILIIISSLSSVICSSTTTEKKNIDNSYLHIQCLNVAPSVFLSSIKTTIEEIRKVTSMLSKFTYMFGDFRVSNAVGDCLDLLDFSADELSWSLSTIDTSTNFTTAGKVSSTGHKHFDLLAWLSAALGNQDTCIDGFDGTDGIIKGLIQGNIQLITSLMSDVLNMVSQEFPSNKSVTHFNPGKSTKFPAWMKPRDRGLLEVSNITMPIDVVVAADGTGNYTTVMEAVSGAPDKSTRRYVIYIKKGIYRENVEIKKTKWNLMMIGEGMDATIISGNRSVVDGWTTFKSATFAVAGWGFIARDMTFENTAGPLKHQAVAFRSDSDLSAYFRCGFKGYQDTLYTHSLRQFYSECKISGTVDFIFGNGAVVFQRCEILARKPLPNQKNTITAHGRKYDNMTTGFSFQFCNISADSDLLASMNGTYTYLGRPWKLYSTTVFMQSYMSSVIRPEGWIEWNGSFALDTLYYAEYMNYGEGAGLQNRVKWPGYHVINTTAEASNFTVAPLIGGDVWLPATKIKYILNFGP